MPRGANAEQRRRDRRAAGRGEVEGAGRALDLTAGGDPVEEELAIVSALEKRVSLWDGHRLPASLVDTLATQVAAATVGFPGGQGFTESFRAHLTEFRMVATPAGTTSSGGSTTTVSYAAGEGVMPEPPPLPNALAWEAVFCPEGVLTDDGRAFAPGSIEPRELPLSLMAMTKTADGHDGAEIAGRIDRIWRDEAAGLIRAAGVFDTSEFGREIARMVDERVLRGISVDIAVARYDVGPRSDWFDDAGNWAPREAAAAADDADEPSLVEIIFDSPADEELVYVVLEGKIGASTVCPFPAFAEATIEIASSLVAGANPAVWTVTSGAGWRVTPTAGAPDADPPAEPAALTAAAAGLAPVAPPAEWFVGPPPGDEVMSLTITEEGRVYGWAAEWGTCHIGVAGVCVEPPTSETDYRWFHLGTVECDDGSKVMCGQFTFDTGHAGRALGLAAATAHYDHTGTVAAHIVVGEDEHGIWFAGALDPNVSAEAVRTLRGAKLSGDWRHDEAVDNLELVALLAVNVPGFPVPRRPRALVACGGDGTPQVLSLVAAGIVNAGVTEAGAREQLAALAAVADGSFADLVEGR